jgi:lipopolysaccharide transport system permease protein
MSAEATTQTPSFAPSAAVPQPLDEELPVLVIRASPGWRAIDLRELWRYRELLYFLTWRDIKVRYKQTVLGAAWAVIQPLAAMLIFTLFFGRLAGLDQRTGSIPYPVFSYAALLPWTFFANALTAASNSLLGNANLISKVYFPRPIIPGSAVLGGLVDYAIALGVLLLLQLRYQVAPPWTAILTVPLLTVLVTALALGVGLWLSALNVEYRDIRYAVPFLVQLWMFGTPIVYPLSIVPPQYRWLVDLNPMAGVVEGFRSALLGQAWDWTALSLSIVLTTVLLFTGSYYFRRLERRFADVV